MNMPKPDPVGQHADQLQPEIDAAAEKGDLNELIDLSVRRIYLTSLAICRGAGVSAVGSTDPSHWRHCRDWRDACDAHLKTGDDYRMTIARDAFQAIWLVQAAQLVRSPTDVGTKGDTASMLLLGAGLGQASVMLGMVTSGIWQEYASAIKSLHNMGAHLRGRIPDWQLAFMPIAKAFCTGKTKVTLGDLVLEARRWAASEIDQKSNPGIPAGDAGIRAGLRKMESRGLSIPGRKRN